MPLLELLVVHVQLTTDDTRRGRMGRWGGEEGWRKLAKRRLSQRGGGTGVSHLSDKPARTCGGGWVFKSGAGSARHEQNLITAENKTVSVYM